MKGWGRGGHGGGILHNCKANLSFKQEDIVHGCSARVVPLNNDDTSLEYYSPDYLEQHKTLDCISPSALHLQWINNNHIRD
jgi:hypothetical protein